MTARLLLSALLAFGPAAPAAAQVRAAVPGSVSVVPGFVPVLAPGLAPSFSAPVLSLPLASDLSAPSIAPALSPAFLAPVPALAASVIPAAAFSPSFVPAALLPGSAPARDAGRGTAHTLTRLKDLGMLVGMADDAVTAAAFDGAAAKAALENASSADLPRPLGTKSVAVVRLNNAREATSFIPRTPNTENFINELEAKWGGIGWLDLRVYTDSKGGRFRAVDLSGRPELADRLPEVQPHEAALIRKIQLHSSDLQLVIREEGKTPDLIVDGVVTRLAPGAAAIDLTLLRDAVPVAELQTVINDYVRSGAAIGLASVSVYAGKDRQVFVRGKDGLFDAQGSRGRLQARASAPKSNARFLVPDALGLANDPDPKVIVREVTEPAKRLRAAGVKATVTVYGYASSRKKAAERSPSSPAADPAS